MYPYANEACCAATQCFLSYLCARAHTHTPLCANHFVCVRGLPEHKNIQMWCDFVCESSPIQAKNADVQGLFCARELSHTHKISHQLSNYVGGWLPQCPSEPQTQTKSARHPFFLRERALRCKTKCHIGKLRTQCHISICVCVGEPPLIKKNTTSVFCACERALIRRQEICVGISSVWKTPEHTAGLIIEA